MKKFLSIFAISMMLLSCSNSTEDLPESETVLVSLDYSFSSNNITRSDDVNTFFYNKIISKELIAERYDLTFTNISTNEVYKCKGDWKDKNTISIKTGKYKVTGSSTADGEYIQNKCSIIFDTEIEIKPSSTNITLPANYDCFLIIFEKYAVKNVSNTYISGNNTITEFLFEYGDIFYAFSKQLYSGVNSPQYLIVTLNDNSSQYIQTNGNSKFEIGKYYVYDSPLKNEFSLPKMVKGYF